MKAFAKDYLFGLTVLTLTCLLAIFSYYILVNTVFLDTALPSVKAQNYSVGMKKEEEIKKIIAQDISEQNKHTLTISYFHKQHHVPVKDLALSMDSTELIELGKSTDLDKTIFSGLDLLFNSNSAKYELDPIPLLKELFPYKDGYRIDINNSDIIAPCGEKTVSVKIDETLLQDKINKSLQADYQIELENNDLLSDPASVKNFNYCIQHNDGSEQIKKVFAKEGLAINNNFDEIFTLKEEEGLFYWEIKDKTQLEKILSKYKKTFDKPAENGESKVIGEKFLLLKKYEDGRSLNADGTMLEIERWVNNPSSKFELIVETTKWQPPENLKLYDFTQQVASGRTRIDIIRNGYVNYGVYNAQAGIEDIDYEIIEPGEEFSYINTIKPQPNGQMQSGRQIAVGICNSTTTLFRAVLEAGFPITERQSHTFSVKSYEWNYPINIVDAAYFTTPEVDLRFVNDLDYPILLRSEISRKDDGYQYHTIHVLTSSENVTREVKLTNWKIIYRYSAWTYKGTFDRIVTEKSGEIVREETFTSAYH